MNRTEKQELVEKLHAEFEAAPHVVLVDFTGLSVPAATITGAAAAAETPHFSSSVLTSSATCSTVSSLRLSAIS
jgi:hypothetical protein